MSGIHNLRVGVVAKQFVYFHPRRGEMQLTSINSVSAVAADFGEVLRRRAAERGDRRAFVFLNGKGLPEAEWTFAELDSRARGIAAALVERGLAGQRALLLFPQGLDFVAALYGCFYAGVVAVPVPFMPGRRTAERLAAIAADARAGGVLTTGALRSDRTVVPEAMADRHLAWIEVEALPTGSPPRPARADLAFLQYTSGSTGTPKGVAISHANLLANCRMIAEAFGDDETTCGVSWLPLFHDMGLVGHVLQPVYLGCTSVLMSPATFFQRPVRWLKAISDWGGTTSGAPTAGYDVCARMVRPEDAEGLDLSSWRLAYCGAEKVRPAILERFAARFADRGFRRGAFFPCYGLAEATLLVTGRHGVAVDSAFATAPESTDGDAVAGDGTLALPAPSCGGPPSGCDVVVADLRAGTALPDGRVGEVWVAGPHVARGYWGEDSGARSFGARLPDGSGPFLRTGDLGFSRGGELFLVGRLKDVLVVSGTNHAAEDVEDVVAGSDPLFTGCGGAAFAVERGDREEAVVVQEVPSRHLRTSAAASAAEHAMAAVVGRCGFRLGRLVLVRQGRLPRTSSGKVQRARARAMFLESYFDEPGAPVSAPGRSGDA